jgi:hypothetical protein
MSCDSKAKIKKPDDLIPPKQMEDLLFDMYVANGAVSVPNLNGEKNVNYMHLVYKKYQIDSVRFAESSLYYTSRVNDQERILRNVKVRLDELREKYRKEQDNTTVLQPNNESNTINKKKQNKTKQNKNTINEINKENIKEILDFYNSTFNKNLIFFLANLMYSIRTLQ